MALITIDAKLPSYNETEPVVQRKIFALGLVRFRIPNVSAGKKNEQAEDMSVLGLVVIQEEKQSNSMGSTLV